MPEPIEIRREKVYVDTSLSIAEIRRKYNLPSSTANGAKKKGYFVKNYTGRQIIIDRSQFDYSIAKKTSERVFYKNFYRDDVAGASGKT